VQRGKQSVPKQVGDMVIGNYAVALGKGSFVQSAADFIQQTLLNHYGIRSFSKADV
jgi:hypothetical protein